jgi:hypothetical protein
MQREDSGYGKRVMRSALLVAFLLGNLFSGILFNYPDVDAGQVDHSNGNVGIGYLSDFGRILKGINWDGSSQTSQDPTGFGYIGLVMDHDGYVHTPGSENIADSFSSFPYASQDDFTVVDPINLVIDDGDMQKSVAGFRNEGNGTGDPYDILINQTCWTVIYKDWAILQWQVNNIKSPGTDITNFKFGLEIPFSKEGARYGVGGDISDAGDDVDGYDASEDVYWVSDIDTGITLGVGSVITADPITHYFAKDYHSNYSNEYKYFFENDTWLYNRLHAPNSLATDGVNPKNITATVGWNGETIPPGGSRTYTIVIAANSSMGSMIDAISDARNYYQDLISGFLITEIRDSEIGLAQIEVYNNGREPTDLSSVLSLEVNGSPISGSWTNTPIPTYGYSVFTVNEAIDSEGDVITLFENGEEVDEVAYGQKGVAPDPLASESTARHYDVEAHSYTFDWVRDPTPTWNSQNDCGYVINSPNLILNRVMFNPLSPEDAYVELMYIGSSQLDISGFKIVCDNEFIIPSAIILNESNCNFVLTYSMMPAFFNEMNPEGDNVYLYDGNDNLLDMVGWSSLHTMGSYMVRSPEGGGTYQGFNDSTSIAAGWVFDHLPTLLITEFYADSISGQIEVHNPNGGEKNLALWTFESASGGPLTGTWSMWPIMPGGYSTFTVTFGSLGEEGDAIRLNYNGSLIDSVFFGTYGKAPDPLYGESTSRYYNESTSSYEDQWTREDTPTWDAQNDVPPWNLSSYILLNEVMFYPSIFPNGYYFVIINRNSHYAVDLMSYSFVSDSIWQFSPSFTLDPLERIIIRYDDNSPTTDPFYDDITPSGDNIYLYDPEGRLCDMVGWSTSHIQGMCVRRVPDGNGTQDGYDDGSSTAAGWIFDSPLEVQITEFSDSESAMTQIEVYNPWYPDIDFCVGFEFRDTTGIALPGSWPIPIVGAGDYGVFDVTSGLESDGDKIGFYQNGILADEIGYGYYGIAPDPLPDESVQRYREGIWHTNVWERNWSTGPNFGFNNDIPPANFTSLVLLNEIMFNPSVPGDRFISLYITSGSLDVSGYRIIGDVVYIIPMGTVMGPGMMFYIFNEAMDSIGFFTSMDQTGDNVYLYDNNGSLLDMAGWSSTHTPGKTMKRVPDGNGTRDGYDDDSSVAAGWVFDHEPSPPPPPPPSPPRGFGAKLVANGANVMLYWNASEDDGSGENDVVGYSVYRSETGINGSYEFADWIEATGSPNYDWIDINAGDGDWNNYFYQVRANDSENSEEKNTNLAGKFVNYLYDNWNLFSVPLNQFDNSLDYVLQTIDDNYTIIQGYHAGKSRPWLNKNKNKPLQLNDEITFSIKEGYYIKMVNPDYLVVAGAVPVNTQIDLKTGWNLVGYPSVLEKTVAEALSSISGKYNMVEYFDPILDKEVRLQSNDLMNPGFGYWIHATEDCTLIL